MMCRVVRAQLVISELARVIKGFRGGDKFGARTAGEGGGAVTLDSRL